MPSNFSEMAGYHNHEAARYIALAQAARDHGKHTDAEYLTNLAGRYVDAARAQKIAMRQSPSPSVALQTPDSLPPEQPRLPLAAACLLAVLRVTEEIVTALSQPAPKENIGGLSLH